jgi:poly(A) polymerase
MELEQLKNLRRWVTDHRHFQILRLLSDKLRVEVFITGGLVRDRIINKETPDVDVTLAREALQLAQLFADQIGGSFVLLREEAETARVVLKGATYDFAKFRGPDLEADLRGRDFTINAIALSLNQAFEEKEWTVIDPLGGIDDLKNEILRMTSPDCFNQDPLRTLRAFRFSSQLSLTVEPNTFQAIKDAAGLLTRTAPERIHHEWLVLLSQPACFHQVELMDPAGLLEVLFPELCQLKNVPQNGYHHLNAFEHSLLSLRYLEEVISGHPLLSAHLEEEVLNYQKGKIKLPWLKWATLLHDLGKAATGEKKGDRLTFYDHVSASQNLFQSIAERYRLSHREKNYIQQMIGWHMRPHHLIQEERKMELSRKALTRFIREVGDDLNGVFLIGLADSLAAQGEEKPADLETHLIAFWEKALEVREEVVRTLQKARPLLTGQDLIDLGLLPGPLFKTLLSDIQEERLEGRITSREEALQWAQRRIASRKTPD